MLALASSLFMGIACGADSNQPGSGPGHSGVGGAGGQGGLDAGAIHNPHGGTGGSDPKTDACMGTACAPKVLDDDGFSVAEGDCDDFSALVNPGAFDVPGNGIDEDCKDGDASSSVCDSTLHIASMDPLDAARAMDLCARTDTASKTWGVISARWTTPDGLGVPGSALAYGMLPAFGSSFAPRGGQRVLAISSGVARATGQESFTANCSDQVFGSSGGLPEGFDGLSPSCPAGSQVTTVVDSVALELQLRVPSNASGLSFDSAFFTDEYPDFICSPFNDFFQVIALPKRQVGSTDGNVVFDLDGNAVSVNNSLLRACEPGTHNGKTFDCPLGFDPLIGTGYEDCTAGGTIDPGSIFGGGFFGGGAGTPATGSARYGASTGWLSTEIALTPGEVITLRFAIWDSGDSALDSLAIIDHMRFRLLDEPPPSQTPVTKPIGPD